MNERHGDNRRHVSVRMSCDHHTCRCACHRSLNDVRCPKAARDSTNRMRSIEPGLSHQSATAGSQVENSLAAIQSANTGSATAA